MNLMYLGVKVWYLFILCFMLLLFLPMCVNLRSRVMSLVGLIGDLILWRLSEHVFGESWRISENLEKRYALCLFLLLIGVLVLYLICFSFRLFLKWIV
jgi:hypothetical protein